MRKEPRNSFLGVEKLEVGVDNIAGQAAAVEENWIDIGEVVVQDCTEQVEAVLNCTAGA